MGEEYQSKKTAKKSEKTSKYIHTVAQSIPLSVTNANAIII